MVGLNKSKEVIERPRFFFYLTDNVLQEDRSYRAICALMQVNSAMAQPFFVLDHRPGRRLMGRVSLATGCRFREPPRSAARDAQD